MACSGNKSLPNCCKNRDCYAMNYSLIWPHGIWKSQKKSHSTLRAKRATFTFWVDKRSIKMPDMVQVGEFLKTWSLRSNSVTRQVSFTRSKIGGKCQNSNVTFWVIFKPKIIVKLQTEWWRTKKTLKKSLQNIEWLFFSSSLSSRLL